MELEQLKQQWEILHKRLDEQEIINKRLMENAVRQKIDFINSYNLFTSISALILIPFLFIVQKQKNLDGILFYFILICAFLFIGFSVFWSLQFAKKMSVKTKTLELEKFLLTYKRYTYISTIIAYIWSIIIFAWTIVIYYDLFVQYNRLEIAIVAYLATFLLIVFIGTRDIKRLKNLHQSIFDLKEFEKE
ncbi:MAG: hypothetical protein VB043_00620 [Petrimonas sp.]|uniref:hypothetical protein n=1 Tax=Petrimonas sp. TaxID=2023866 RepID=UPI002B38320F|nr:hypothetical protein [Petrimonas sp.]